MPKDRKAAERLFEIAVQQQGYFTQKQAMIAGYNRNATYFYAKTGEWIREKRGIYRLAKFPLADRPDLVLWALWSANRKGEIQWVFSHATALALYNITDANPAKLHMTVPASFRKRNPIPPGIILNRQRSPNPKKAKYRDTLLQHLSKRFRICIQRNCWTLPRQRWRLNRRFRKDL